MFAALSLLALASVQQSSLTLDLVPSGTFKRIGGYAPIGIPLTDAKPTSLVKTPTFTAPRFGSVEFGGQSFAVVLDGHKLYVDSNGNGDITDDPAPTWEQKTFKSYGVDKTEWDGFATIDLPYKGKQVACRIGVYDMGDPKAISCYVDFGLAGEIQLGGKTYPAILSDTSGKFEVSADKDRSAILMIDLEKNGRFNPGYEFFRVAEPFNIGGTTYELKGKAADLSVAKSSHFVAERSKNVAPPDPNLANGLRPGSAALKFSATSTLGRSISFPSSFAGKVVMIDFWATWCGPCMREVPNLSKVYSQLHGKGFEVLGVSLDQENSGAAVKTVTAKNGMTWDQIYDGKFWKSAIATQYGIKGIPASYLIDGDTGKILAIGDSLRGAQLEATVNKALKAKKPATSPK